MLSSSRLYHTFPAPVAVVTAVLAIAGFLYSCLLFFDIVRFDLGLAAPLSWPVLLLTTFVPLLYSTLSMRQAVRQAGFRGSALWSGVHIVAAILTLSTTVTSAILSGAASVDQAVVLVLALVVTICCAMTYAVLGACAGFRLRSSQKGDGRTVGAFWLWTSLGLLLFSILLVAAFVMTIIYGGNNFAVATTYMLAFVLMMLTAQAIIPWVALSRPNADAERPQRTRMPLTVAAGALAVSIIACIAINLLQPKPYTEDDTFYDDELLDYVEPVPLDDGQQADDSIIITEYTDGEWTGDSLESTDF